MHPQLEILLQIQDLRTQRERLSAAEAQERTLQREEFHIDVDEAVETLSAKIREMEDELDGPIRTRYDRIASTGERVVAPVIHGTCYACFVSIPTSRGASAEGNSALHNCENCGRFLYMLR